MIKDHFKSSSFDKIKEKFAYQNEEKISLFLIVILPTL